MLLFTQSSVSRSQFVFDQLVNIGENFDLTFDIIVYIVNRSVRTTSQIIRKSFFDSENAEVRGLSRRLTNTYLYLQQYAVASLPTFLIIHL